MDKDKNTDKSSFSRNSGKRITNITDPEARFKGLSDSVMIEINPTIAPQKYYRSGVEMIRMATIYNKGGDLERAYNLYMKFMILFLEKIMKHPQYNSVASVEKAKNQETLKQIIPIAEELKKKIMVQYKSDAARYIAEEKERLKNAEKNKPSLVDTPKDENYKSPTTLSSFSPGSLDQRQQPEEKPQSGDKNTPSFDRSLKPLPVSNHRFGLSDLLVPQKMLSEFLRLSNANTLSNKETCGILAGKLGTNQFFVTHLLIPHQSGSPDSCLTHNEEDIFDYQDQHGLITLGWIHTHPTQTAFLSSVDLHTHCAYQLMLPEAIAVVCAPKYDETGFFMLTPEHGLNFIARCRATGFHPHPNEKTLYTHADHCKLDARAEINVVDLRKKKI